MSVGRVSREPRAIDFDRWMIVNLHQHHRAGTEVVGRPSLTLDEVEAYLTFEDR